MEDCPPTEVEALKVQNKQLILDLLGARNTNRRLNRRNQNLERQVRRAPNQTLWWREHKRAEYWGQAWYWEASAKMDALEKVRELEAENERLKAALTHKTEQTP